MLLLFVTVIICCMYIANQTTFIAVSLLYLFVWIWMCSELSDYYPITTDSEQFKYNLLSYKFAPLRLTNWNLEIATNV